MKTSPSFAALRSAILGLAVAAGISAQGAVTTATAVTGKKKTVAAGAVVTQPAGTANAVGLLDEAYGLLRSADHDYKGHRGRAMHQIEAAARELGTKLRGDGKTRENQGTSDSQLRNAQSLLQQAIGGLAGKPLHHVQDAIKQLGIALSVK
jgi:hypothetical protein